jgi:thioglycine synthase
MKRTLSRNSERERSARFLNSLEPEELWTMFGISRVAEISGFDIIGVPIWTSTRPSSLSVAINSGKGLNAMMARAGAVAEGIEFHYAQTAQPVQRQQTIGQMYQWGGFDLVPSDKWHLAKGAVITDRTLLDWDLVAHIQNLDAAKFLLPSGAIYLVELDTPDLIRFQSSTNGWATGASRDDAVLQGLYEVVERDGWTIWHYLIENYSVWPPRMEWNGSQDPWLIEMLSRLDEQSLKAVCFDIRTDTALPSVWTILYDLSDRPSGVFSGYGTAWTWKQAVRRAVLEAIQSRACYIAGARDDLYRRSFLLLKGVDQSQGYAQAMSLPGSTDVYNDDDSDLSSKGELQRALQRLEEAGFSDLYVRDCGLPFVNNPFSVVKVYAPCLEQWRCAYWQPTKRLGEFVGRYVNK